MCFDPQSPGGSTPGGVKKLTKLTPPLVMLAALLLGGCGRGEDEGQATAAATNTPAPVDIGAFAGEGRDRLCLKSGTAEGGVITYAAQGDTNCSLRFGTANPERLEAANDPSCTIPLSRNGDRLTLGQPSAGCAYYCGPGASLEGKSFVRMDKAEPVTDLAGDPLC